MSMTDINAVIGKAWFDAHGYYPNGDEALFVALSAALWGKDLAKPEPKVWTRSERGAKGFMEQPPGVTRVTGVTPFFGKHTTWQYYPERDAWWCVSAHGGRLPNFDTAFTKWDGLLSGWGPLTDDTPQYDKDELIKRLDRNLVTVQQQADNAIARLNQVKAERDSLTGIVAGQRKALEEAEKKAQEQVEMHWAEVQLLRADLRSSASSGLHQSVTDLSKLADNLTTRLRNSENIREQIARERNVALSQHMSDEKVIADLKDRNDRQFQRLRNIQAELDRKEV